MLSWCRKYLLEGQKLDEKYSEKLKHFPENPTISDYILIKYRKFVAVLIPFLLVQAIWWSTAVRYNLFTLFNDYWHMPVTMLLGSLIAGMTAEGASAVSFPVMTLVLHLSPTIARDFALMIQSIDGQVLSKSVKPLPENPTVSDYILIKYRKFVAVLIPFILVQSIWWSAAIRFNIFHLYHDYWHMPVTMIGGALVSGMSAEGASAVSFPVMTLILHLSPTIARDFALMIQSIAVLIPFVLIQSIWWSAAIRYNIFYLYNDYWHMPVTMLIGALIAGMTAEGASAVSFPVMTLVLHLSPSIARDFSLMTQSIGMTSSLVCVIFMKVKFEAKAVIFGIIGAFPGFVFGVYFFDPLFTGSEKKMMFVSIWTAFAFALALLNSQKKRSTFMKIQEFSSSKVIILIIVGFIGGIFDSFAGSGIDICIFSVITLYFRVSEKIATPTTMILKGVVSVFGFYYRAVLQGDISTTSWNYFICCVPVASLMAPVGSFLGSHLHRQVVAGLIYILEIVSLCGFYLTGPGMRLIIISVVIILCGFGFFFIISKLGERKMLEIEARNAEKIEKLPTVSSKVSDSSSIPRKYSI